MASVENEMKSLLRSITKNTIFRYGTQERTNWIASSSTLGMASNCGTRVWWTGEVEDGLTKLATGDKDELKEIEAKWANQISNMVSMIRSPLGANVRKKINNLFAVDIHAKDIISSFKTI